MIRNLKLKDKRDTERETDSSIFRRRKMGKEGGGRKRERE